MSTDADADTLAATAAQALARIPDRGVPAPHLARVAPGVHAWVQPDGSWMLNNCGAVTSGGEVLLVDTTTTEARTRAFLAAVAAATGGVAPKLVVNTHHHGDHTFGNHLAGCPVLGSAGIREEVLRSGTVAQGLFDAGWGDVRVTPPDVVFDGTASVFVGEREVLCTVVGPAHTLGDVAVFVPDVRVLFTGDLVFHGGMPFLVEGSLRRYPAALERLRAMGADILVPGHGEPVSGARVDAVLVQMQDFAGWLTDYAATTHAAGRPIAEAAARAGEDERFAAFGTWTEGERLVGNLARAYAEIEGAPDAAPLSYAVIAPEMVAAAGGPLRCCA